MAKLQTIENVVLQVLEDFPETRKDDYLLMFRVCDIICPDVLIDCFGAALTYHKEYGLPNWKSVERARRKIQGRRPDLVDDKTAAVRLKEEAEYIEYARA